jgi:hypothetical protein
VLLEHVQPAQIRQTCSVEFEKKWSNSSSSNSILSIPSLEDAEAQVLDYGGRSSLPTQRTLPRRRRIRSAQLRARRGRDGGDDVWYPHIDAASRRG